VGLVRHLHQAFHDAPCIFQRLIFAGWAMEKYQSPSDALPDEHMRLIGIISAHWEWLELLMERAIAEIMEHEFTSVALLTTNIGFRSKCELLMAYARPFKTENQPENWKEFISILDQIKAAYALRNTFVHAKWKIDQTTRQIGLASVRTAGGKFGIVDEHVPINRLNDAAQAIWGVSERFLRFCQGFGVLLKA
jgi:hypothetical protein